MYELLAIIGLFGFIYSITSGVRGRSIISGAITFTAFGLAWMFHELRQSASQGDLRFTKLLYVNLKSDTG